MVERFISVRDLERAIRKSKTDSTGSSYAPTKPYTGLDVYIKNNTGENLSVGELCKIDGFIPCETNTSTSRYSQYLNNGILLNGVRNNAYYASDCIGMIAACALEPIPANGIGRACLLNAFPAIVQNNEEYSGDYADTANPTDINPNNTQDAFAKYFRKTRRSTYKIAAKSEPISSGRFFAILQLNTELVFPVEVERDNKNIESDDEIVVYLPSYISEDNLNHVYLFDQNVVILAGVPLLSGGGEALSPLPNFYNATYTPNEGVKISDVVIDATWRPSGDYSKSKSVYATLIIDSGAWKWFIVDTSNTSQESVSVAKSTPKATRSIGSAGSNQTKTVLTATSESESTSVLTDASLGEVASGTGISVASGAVNGPNSFAVLTNAGQPLFAPVTRPFLTGASLVSASGASASNVNYQSGFMVDSVAANGFTAANIVAADPQNDPNPTTLIQNLRSGSTDSTTVLTNAVLKKDGVTSMAGLELIQRSAGNNLSTVSKDGVVKNISVNIDGDSTQTLVKKLQLEGTDTNGNVVWNDVTEVEFISGIACVNNEIVVSTKKFRVVSGSLVVSSTPINVVTDVVDNLSASVLTLDLESADIKRANIENHTIAKQISNLSLSTSTDSAVKTLGENLSEGSISLATKNLEVTTISSEVASERITFCQKYEDVNVVTELDPVDVVKYPLDSGSESGQ